jgi:mono/diheme cytochrome c family protein
MATRDREQSSGTAFMKQNQTSSKRSQPVRRIAIVLSLLSVHIADAVALEPAAQRGQTFARVHCARCHAIDKVSPSPLAIAPPFRTLHKRYPVESLQEALAEGIMTGHPSMPEFQLDGAQIRDVIAFLKSLER